MSYLPARSLGFWGMFYTLLAFALGVVATSLWFYSIAQWDRHLARADVEGRILSEALATGEYGNSDFDIRPLSAQAAEDLRAGRYGAFEGLPRPRIATNFTVRTPNQGLFGAEELSLILISDTLQYPISKLNLEGAVSRSELLGSVLELVSRYCSDVALFAKPAGKGWFRIESKVFFACEAAPRDYRLFAVLIGFVGLAILGSAILGTTSHFTRFAEALTQRLRNPRHGAMAHSGPKELREIATAMNQHLEKERAQLSDRALILSGVSHDLGTPAQRLRLRSALISDVELREKFEADIDSMSEMIESVLSYTRAELNSEEPTKLSLMALVHAVVDDFVDVGKPVRMVDKPIEAASTHATVFSGKAGQAKLPKDLEILMIGQPISLKRAFTNLIENALRYGRRADVSIHANAHSVLFVVEDEGTEIDAREMEDLIAPYKRGKNNIQGTGTGLGLTITKTVAEQHGGRLYFENGSQGLRSCIELMRQI